MAAPFSAVELEALGLGLGEAVSLADRLNRAWAEPDPARRWSLITATALSRRVPPAVHRAVFARNYAGWNNSRGPAPAWSPSPDEVPLTNLGRLLAQTGLQTLDQLDRWAFEDPGRFWRTMVDVLGIRFQTPPTRGADLPAGGPPRWLPGARLNIASSCFAKPTDDVALIAHNEAGRARTLTTGELEDQARRFAGALHKQGLIPGDAVALVMPLTVEAVVAYLGTILAGGAAVCIADSFAAGEIDRRVRIGNAKLLVTQDEVLRAGKRLPLYDKLRSVPMPRMIVASAGLGTATVLRDGDVRWDDFVASAAPADPVVAGADHTTTVLFSSGTTADPKAIPWPQTTPIKCAADAFLYQDIRPTDVVSWPTSMGWMMGPWLIFAALVNRATLALFDGHPASPAFARFVESAGVTVLGLVPSLVTAWNASGAWEAADWSRVRLFSSTGECSQPEQMLTLMARCGYRPVIEYCGGTEIGGGYLASTVLRPIAPSGFNQAVFGLRLSTFGEDGRPADRGEVFLSGAAMGLSTRLLNGDHHATYYAGTPQGEGGEPLRRHGDEVAVLSDGYYRVLGRADDAMNLGGIKVAAVEIERVVNRHPGVAESAAVAVSDDGTGGGPGRLVVFAVPRQERREAAAVQRELQDLLRRDLNPLFQIARLEWIDALPRTASNKVMRRLLRDRLRPPVDRPR